MSLCSLLLPQGSVAAHFQMEETINEEGLEINSTALHVGMTAGHFRKRRLQYALQGAL